MIFRTVKALILTGCLGALLAPSESAAQQSQPPAAANDLQEIVVTANKRVEDINKVGMTVTALSGSELQERGISSLQDISGSVPGLVFAPSTTNTPILTLRGVGFNDTSIGVYPTVSVYIDEIPLPFPVLAAHSAYDLQRVEVLKGPQGTLFGENSTGGAINLIAAKPTTELAGGVNLSYGSFNDVQTNAFISGPLGNGFSARVAVTSDNSTGWQHSYTRGADNGAVDYIAGRLLLGWENGGPARFMLNLNFYKDDSQPLGQQLVAVIPTIPSQAKPGEENYPFAPQSAYDADWGPADPRSHRNFVQAALRSDFDLTERVRLTSLTSFDTFSQHQNTDGDGANLSLYDLNVNDGSIHSFNQELRIANSDAAALNWVAGANFENSRTFENEIINFFDTSNNNAANLFINQSGDYNTQKIRNYAFFGHAQYALNDLITLKGGARYTDSHIEATNCGYSSGDGNVATLFNLLGNIVGKVPFTPITPSDCYTLNNNLVPGQIYTNTLAQNNVSWVGGIDFHLAPSTMLYGNVSRGYKAGSFPTLAASTYTQLAPVSQEKLTSYEIGIKSQPSTWVQLNAAAFYYDYRDKQVHGKIQDQFFGLLEKLINVPKSRILGVESDITLRPIEALTISASATYLDSQVLAPPGNVPTGFNFLGQPDTFTGDALPFTPKWLTSANVDYHFQPFRAVTPFIGITTNWRSSQSTTLGGDKLEFPASPVNRILPGLSHVNKIEAYSTTDIRLGIESSDARWSAQLWGKNIFNKYYWTNVIQAVDSEARIPGMPATFGVSAMMKFN